MPVINAEERTDLQNCMHQIISSLFADEEYAFEVFILMKGDRKLKKFVLYEGAPENRNNTEINFKKKLQIAIADVIKGKYGIENAEYDLVENVADNQNKFYVIPQTDEYKPFDVLGASSAVNESYCVSEREAAEGIFFRYEREGKVLWAFQYFWPNAIPNRKGTGFHIIPQDDVFVELKKPILAVTQKVDLLVIDDQIVTNDVGLLQTHYDFQRYVRTTATHIVSEITTLDFVSNMDKVTEYISRSRLTYALFYSKGRGIIAVGQIVTDTPTEVGDEKNHSVRMIVPENFNGDVKALPALSPNEIKTILKRNFYWASTIKTPFLTGVQVEMLIRELKKKHISAFGKYKIEY